MLPKKNILIISNPLKEDYGGGETFLENLISGLEDTFQFSFLGKSKYIEQFFKDKKFQSLRSNFGYEPVTVKNLLLLPISFILSSFQIIKHFKLFKSSDLVVLPAGFTENFTLMFWLFVFRKKVVQIVHTRCPRSIHKSPVKFLFQLSWNYFKVVFVSHDQAQDWFSNGFRAKNEIVIYNGIQISPNQNFKINESNSIIIGYLGRLHKEKGVDVFLNSLLNIKASKKLIVKIAGTGSELQFLQEQATEITKKTSINIEFVGFQAEPAKFVDTLDLLIAPSFKETFGLVIFEAMERGIMVINSDLKVFLEIKEKISEDYLNLNFKTGDSNDLAEKINYFIQNFEKYNQVSTKKFLHNYVAENFSLNTMNQKYLQLFNEII